MQATHTVASMVPPHSSSDSLHHVHPGRTVASTDGENLASIVGSGAVVCVWDPVRGVGGMSHFLLPEVGNAPPATRFGDVAMKMLLAELSKLGADESRLRARVYGGSAPPIADGNTEHLGVRNVAQAIAFLSSKNVPVVDRDVGGSNARKVVFSPRRGTAEVSRIDLA